MTLNVKIVRARVRIGGWARSQRIPSAISDRRPDRSRRSAVVLRTTRETSSAPSTKQTAFVANGSGDPGREQEGADGWRHQLVRQEERTLHPGIRESEVLAAHEIRQERAARRVSERLRRGEDEQRDEDHGDADGAADDRGDEDDQSRRPTEVHHDDHPAPVEPVRERATEDTEEQGREVSAQDRHRDEERIARLRGHEQRSGGEHDAVADVVDECRGQQPAEASPEPRWDDGLGRPGDE